MVGPMSPFHPKNAPPEQYLTPEVIMEKPCKIDLTGVNTSKIPYSGKLGNLGYRIIEDSHKANYVTSLDWKEEQFKNYGRVSPHKKPEREITQKLTFSNFANKTG